MTDKLAQIAEQLAWQSESWRSIHLRVQQVYRYEDASKMTPSTYDRVDYDYVETKLGQRYLERLAHRSDGKLSRTRGYCDGAKCALVHLQNSPDEGQDEASIGRSFWLENRSGDSQRPMPLKAYYAGKKSLAKVLKSGSFLGERQAGAYQCNVVEVKGIEWGSVPQNLTYYFDIRTGIPVRIEARLKKRPDRLSWHWEADNIVSAQGHYYPQTSKLVHYDLSSTASSPTVWLIDEIAVTSVEYDKNYQASAFWPEFRPGTKVWDSLSKKRFTVPETQSHKATAEATKVIVPDPIRVAEPTSGPSLLALSLCVAGCLAIVLAALVVWRRRR